MLLEIIQCICLLIITFIMSYIAGFILYNLFHVDSNFDEDEEWVDSKKVL